MRPTITASLLFAFAGALTVPANAQVPTPEPYVGAKLAPAKTITLKACNYATIAISVAVAYAGKTGESAQGWWGVAPKGCVVIGPFSFTSGRFAYFSTLRNTQGDERGGLYCVDMTKGFTLENALRAPGKKCEAGQDLRAFDIITVNPALPATDKVEWDFDFYP